VTNKELETKLAKAIEALKFIRDYEGGLIQPKASKISAMKETARRVLQEIYSE
jgi:hypothetical protein